MSISNSGQFTIDDLSFEAPAIQPPPAGVPEPGTFVMLLTGLISVSITRRRAISLK